MGKNNRHQPGRMPVTRGMDMASVFTPKDCARKAKNIVYSNENKVIIDEFITIVGMKEKFAEHEVPVPNKIVMYGPPGTGKTLTAFHLAHQLDLPLVIVRLDSLIHAYLGETGSNIRKVFEYAKYTPCVLFMDEFDAIARTRDNNDEIKEMARVVNTLLQCLDEFHSDSIFMAATNLANELDHAIWRRFDTKMTFYAPDESSRVKYLNLLLGQFPIEDGLVQVISSQLQNCSYADIEQI